MNGSPSRYGGVAAVIVFGIGLLAVGRTKAGIAVLGAGVLVLVMLLSPTGAARAFVAGVGALVVSGIMTYCALSNEITGTAVYHETARYGWRFTSEPVTRGSAPDKFREATNFLWAGSVIGLLAGTVAIGFSRRLEGGADDV